MSLTKREKEAGYRPVPLPTATVTNILRRVAKGFLMVTHCEDGEVLYCYDDGTVIRDHKRRVLSKRAINHMIREHWLIPIEGESMFGGPPQRYRARTVDDGPLPRFVKR